MIDLNQVMVNAFYDEMKIASASLNIPLPAQAGHPLINELARAAWNNKGNLALMAGGALAYNKFKEMKNRYDMGSQLEQR